LNHYVILKKNRTKKTLDIKILDVTDI